jgi:hypothetical protein
MNQSASVFVSLQNVVAGWNLCVCYVQSSDPRFSNACGEPMAPPPPCNPKAWAQSSKLTCCSPERLLSSSQPLMCRLRYLTCHKGRTSMLLGKLTQNPPPAIESVAFLSHHENHMGCVMYRGRHSSCCQCFPLCSNNGCVCQSYFNMPCHWHMNMCCLILFLCEYVDIVQKIVYKGYVTPWLCHLH